MSVFSGRGVMAAQADSFPLSVAGPRMQRGGMGRLELLLWSGQPVNVGMVPAQLTQYQGAGLTVTGWSVHRPGEDHGAVMAAIRTTWPGTEIVGLNMNLEAGWFLEPGQQWDPFPAISLEHATLLAAAKDAFGTGFPLAVTIIPAKVYPFGMWEGAIGDFFVELYDGDCRPLGNASDQYQMTLAQTDGAGIARSRVHPCVVWEQLPTYKKEDEILLYDSDRTPDEGYR
jgi:hypothetical protein